MQTPFDKIAPVYDELFTGTAIGKMQRNIVYKYLEMFLPATEQKKILELNCGTGEDAVYFAKKGFMVVATDVSDEMLKIAEQKISSLGVGSYVTTKKLDLNNPSDFNFVQKFDIVFSNFGGLNCINKESLKKLSFVLSNILNEKGRIILVIMPKFSMWDSFYFMMKIKPNKIFRRASQGPLNVNLNGENVPSFYYTPKDIVHNFRNNFGVKNIKPVGLFVPPSFLNKFFLKKKRTLNLLAFLENHTSRYSFLANCSDHFLIDLELKR